MKIKVGGFKDISGKKFNRWTVISFSHVRVYKSKKGHKDTRQRMWNCICDCGLKRIVCGYNLTSLRSISCGCYVRENNSLEFGESCINDVYSKYKHAAKKRNFVFELNRDEFIKITSRDCFYCGEKPRIRHSVRKSINGKVPINGIDRQDSNIGYSIENCVACCEKCNFMKMKLSADDFIFHAEKISSFQKDKEFSFPPSYLTVIA